MSNTPTTDTDWSPLGEQRWRELGEAAGCTELQLRFGVARFQGASQTAAARLAGYEGKRRHTAPRRLRRVQIDRRAKSFGAGGDPRA